MGVRFAPSPTGRFHVGNLRTAWISYRWSRTLGEPWVVRFEDIDKPRNIEGAQEQQLLDLSTLGMEPDRLIIQSQNIERHWQVFQAALQDQVIYPCFCSRREILEAMASAPHTGAGVYTGRCRDLKNWPEYMRANLAWRFRHLPDDSSQDFIVARTAPPDGQGNIPHRDSFAPAYQWACAIDDYDGDYKLLVRAYDLLDSATGQRAVQAWLTKNENSQKNFSAVFHTSLVVGDDFSRLEKRTKGVTLDEILQAGLTPQNLIERFRQTFDARFYPFQPSEIFGEKVRQITLNHLGL
jgi:glutamyl-tRNA synthetase